MTMAQRWDTAVRSSKTTGHMEARAMNKAEKRHSRVVRTITHRIVHVWHTQESDSCRTCIDDRRSMSRSFEHLCKQGKKEEATTMFFPDSSSQTQTKPSLLRCEEGHLTYLEPIQHDLARPHSDLEPLGGQPDHIVRERVMQSVEQQCLGHHLLLLGLCLQSSTHTAPGTNPGNETLGQYCCHRVVTEVPRRKASSIIDHK